LFHSLYENENFHGQEIFHTGIEQALSQLALAHLPGRAEDNDLHLQPINTRQPVLSIIKFKSVGANQLPLRVLRLMVWDIIKPG